MKRKLIAGLLSLIIAMIFLNFYIIIKQQNNKATEKANSLIALQRLTDVTDIVQKEINKSFEYTEFLDLMITTNPEKTTENFNTYASLILEKNRTISNLQLAPDGIVEFIYPKAGNEAALLHNLLTDPKRYPFIKESIEKRIPISQGPVESLQGKTLVFNRKAIFIDDKFWGLSVVTIDFEELLKECGISKASKFFSYAIRAEKVDGINDYIWGSSELFEVDSVKKNIQLPGQVWEIAIYPKSGWNDTSHILKVYDIFVIISTLVIVLLVYFHIYNYLTKMEKSRLDSLTQTLNVGSLRRYVKINLKRYRKKKHAIIVMDLNKFKTINDNYGHPIGDAVLVEVSKRLNQVMSNKDRLSRIGGDEFIVFLSDIEGIEQVKAVINCIMEVVKEPMSFNEVTITAGISVGYALYPEEGTYYDELYPIADSRMYDCK